MQSDGKRLGKLVLYVFLLLVCNLTVILSYDFIYNEKLHVEDWITVLGLVLTCLGIVWGAKASSNFAKRKIKREVE